MNKSMLMGVVAGVGVATAGGVLGYQYLGEKGPEVAVEAEQEATSTAAPAARTAAAPTEECWDEEVQVTEAPKDEHRIAGTAIGAVVGGAIGKEINDSDFSTAAGAAAGAFIGRRLKASSRRTAKERARRRPSSGVAARWVARRANPVVRLGAVPATARPLFSACRPANRNANDLQHHSRFGTLAARLRRTLRWFARRFSGFISCAASLPASSCS
jgi:uncharacterized protein YcfJ